ncbi:MAG: sodium:solute symporter family protein, partial [Kordiimonadaceae bacterium]|nr:sodium:solute symporter family protein [Kordiimonadaceae bacterium]
SGSKGVLLTDTLMFLLFTFASILVVYYVIGDFGGVAAAVESLAQIESKPDIASWHGTVGLGTEWPTGIDYLIWTVIIDVAWGVAYAVGPWQAGRHLMAKNEHVVLRSSIYACMIVLLLELFIYGLGGLVNIVNPDILPVETVMIWLAKNMVPEFLGALLLAGIMAAALSSASTFLSLVGFSVSNDIIKREQPLTIKTTRYVMMGIGIIVLLASFYFPSNIFWLMIFIGTIFTSAWGVVAFMSVWSKKITESAAFWGMVSGLVFNVVPATLVYFGQLELPVYLNPVVIGVVASLVVTIAISRHTKVSRKEVVYRMRLHRSPAEDCDPAKVKITLIAPVAFIIFGTIMPILLMIYYVVPYQKGAGKLLVDGSIDWFSGEFMMLASWWLIQIPLGIIAYSTILKRYRSSQKGSKSNQMVNV